MTLTYLVHTRKLDRSKSLGTHMTTSLFRPYLLRIALSIPLLISPVTVLGAMSFPSNPQTRAECDGPAAQMRAMAERESALRRQEYKEAEAMSYESAGARYRALMQLMAKHGKENDRIRKERYALEKTCRAAARANQKLAAESKQGAVNSILELKGAYEKAKGAYEKAKDIYEKSKATPSEFIENAANNAKDKIVGGVVESAYARRNNAYSDALERAMNKAKQNILDLVPKSQIVGAIQDASFDQLKSQIQQLHGDMAALESAIQSVRAEAPPTSRDAGTEALPRRGGNSGSALFQNAINQAEQEEKDRPARVARERAVKAAAVAAEARQTPEDRLRKNYDQRITAAREQCTASKESCDSGCTGVAVVGLLTMFASKGAGADEASAQIQQCSNRCDGAKSSCDEQVSNLEHEKLQAISDARNPPRPTSSSSGMAQAPSGGGARGLPVEECHRQANASNLGDKLNAIPRSDTVLLLRGTIHNLDFLIRTYTQCLPEQGSQNAINGWKMQREQSLRTCRQISSSDNCLDSPFNAAANQDLKRWTPPKSSKCLSPFIKGAC